MNEYEKALDLVNRLFKEKKDKGGYPYINHLLYVSNHGRNEIEKTAGLLHDTLEDTDTSVDDLKKMGFSKEVIDIVVLMTHDKNEIYESYVDRIIGSKNVSAMYLKICDLVHNMDIKRINNPTKMDYERINVKYKPTYDKIKKVMEEIK